MYPAPVESLSLWETTAVTVTFVRVQRFTLYTWYMYTCTVVPGTGISYNTPVLLVQLCPAVRRK